MINSNLKPQDLFLIISCYLALGCSNGSDGSSGANGSPTSSVQDFQKTKIATSSNSTIADGVNVITVTVQLINSDNSYVTNYTPSYTITPSSGVIPTACTLSNSSGLSTCTFKSTEVGNKIFQLTNPKIDLSASLNFTLPNGEEAAVAIAGAQINGTTSDGYTVNMSLGGPLQKFNSTTGEGYKLTFFVGRQNKK